MAIQFNSAFSLNFVSGVKKIGGEESQPETKSFGKKYETLIRVGQFIEARKIEGVKVPFQVGLATEDMELLLKENGSCFFECWQKLQGLFESCLDKKQFLNSDEVQALIGKMQQEIIGAVKDEPWERIWNIPEGYWMVRSSGEEDGKIAAAGYLLSLDYIPSHGIGEALGKVLASCVDPQFFSNLISRGINPFEKYQLSAFVHELIGESMGGEMQISAIPKSVILFTNEPLYVQGQDFRMMRLSATYGHCAALTDSTKGIASDTLLIAQNGKNDPYIAYDNQIKPERLAPLEGELTPYKNPEELMQQPVLDQNLIRRLFNLGLLIEELFEGEPTDMELVIKNEIIYIVQARGVNRTSSDALYLDPDKLPIKTKEMKVIVPGHYQAFTIQDPSQYICVNNLLDVPNQDYKLVIVHREEPANSHPVINLSERNIPCFFHPEEIPFPDNGEIMMVCPQQGIVAQGPQETFHTKSGYTEHPAPISFGFHALPRSISPAHPHILALIKQIKLAQIKQVVLEALDKLTPYFTTFSKKALKAKAFAGSAKQLQHCIEQTLHHLKCAFDFGQRLEILFYTKALKVLLLETNFSLLSLTETLKKTTAYEKTAPNSTLSAYVTIPTLTLELQQKWIQFLKEIETHEDKAKLQQLLHYLKEKRSLWLTFYFDSYHGKNLPSPELLNLLLEDLDDPSHHFLNTLPQYISRASIRLLGTFGSSAFIEGFKQSKPLARLISLGTLYQAVDSYDQLLKAIKKQPQFETKIKEFKSAFPPFYQLMQKLALGLFAHRGHLSPNMTHYFRMLDAALDRLMEAEEKPEQLLPSADFVVSAAVLGSAADINRHLPKTWEDFFTLSHQGIMALIAALYQQNLPQVEELNLPVDLKTTHQQLLKVPNLQQIGIEQKEDELTFFYNIPLRGHSSTCQLSYRSGKIYFSVQLLGQGRDRWPAIAAFLRILNDLKIQPTDQLIHRRDLVDVTWLISTEDKAEQLISLMRAMHTRSFDGVNTSLINYFHAHIEKEFWTEKSARILKLVEKNDLLLTDMIIESLTSYKDDIECIRQLIWKIARYCFQRKATSQALKLMIRIAQSPLEEEREEILEITSNSLDTQLQKALECLTHLVRNGYACDKAVDTLQHRPLRRQSFELFEALSGQVDLVQTFEVICQKILKGEYGENIPENTLLEAFFQTLNRVLKKGAIPLQKVIESMEFIVNDSETKSVVKYAVFGLFSTLIQENRLPPEYQYLIPLFARKLSQRDVDVVNLLHLLLTKKLAYEEIYSVVQYYLEEPNEFRLCASIKMGALLKDQGHAVPEELILKIFNKSFEFLHQNPLRLQSFKLFEALSTQKGDLLPTFDAICTKILKSEYAESELIALHFFTDTLDHLLQKEAIPLEKVVEFMELIAKDLSKAGSTAQSATFVLLQRLIHESRLPSKYLSLIPLFAHSKDPIRIMNIDFLIQTLLTKNLARDEALLIATLFLKDPNEGRLRSAMEIFSLLVYQGYAIPEAKAALSDPSISNPAPNIQRSIERLEQALAFRESISHLSPNEQIQMNALLPQEPVEQMDLW